MAVVLSSTKILKNCHKEYIYIYLYIFLLIYHSTWYVDCKCCVKYLADSHVIKEICIYMYWHFQDTEFLTLSSDNYHLPYSLNSSLNFLLISTWGKGHLLWIIRIQIKRPISSPSKYMNLKNNTPVVLFPNSINNYTVFFTLFKNISFI